MASRWGRIQLAGAVLLPLLSIGFLIWRSGSPDVPFVARSDAAPWIQPNVPVSAELQQWGREDVPVVRYTRRIEVAEPTQARLVVRALREHAVELNGAPVVSDPPTGASSGSLPGSLSGSDWRVMTQLPLPLRAGQNELSIEVRNRHGPALLSLRVEGAGAPIRSDASWDVRIDDRPVGRARSVDDTRANPLALTVETPLEALVERRNALAVCFVVGALAAFGAIRFGRGSWQLATLAAGAAVAAGWILLWIDKLLRIPLNVGFDARHHLFYVDFLREQGSVPLATDGWSVYHPPLFYGFAALLSAACEAVAGEAGASFGLKLLPFAAGLANVWVAYALSRRLAPGSSSRALFALLFAGVLPMNLYSAAYFSNETFHALVAGLAILAVVDLLRVERATWRRVVVLGALLGLALNTKFTALLVTAVGGFFLLVKLVAVDREPWPRAAARVFIVGAVAALLAGWFYVRNWLEYGDPLMANWGAMPGSALAWWQQPGFHTLPYFTSFGESLRHPYLSAFHSFWDSVYSTLWGDGGIAGRVSPQDRLSLWNYRWMSAGYLVALPATALIGIGTVRAAMTALTDSDPRRRAVFSFLLTFVYTVLFGLLYLALRLPYFAQGKASYGLVVMAPLSALFAEGLAACDEALARRGWWPARLVVFGWFATFLAAMFLAYAG